MCPHMLMRMVRPEARAGGGMQACRFTVFHVQAVPMVFLNLLLCRYVYGYVKIIFYESVL